METVASDGWMLTNQRAIAHSVEEVSHASEREIQFYSPRCTASFGEVFAWHFWQDLSIDSVFYEQQRRSCSAFHYILVQYKRRTMHQNTLIAISLRCNPLSSIFFFLSEPYILLTTSSAGVFSAQVCLTAAFTSCRYWESSSVSQESHLYTEQGQHGAPPLSEAWSQRQRQTYWCIQIW